MYQVETGIPVPDLDLVGSKQLKYPWDEMEVGDCFYVPAHECGSTGKYRKIGDAPIRATCERNKKGDGKHFVAVRIREDGVFVGIRVWRINPPED